MHTEPDEVKEAVDKYLRDDDRPRVDLSFGGNGALVVAKETAESPTPLCLGPATSNLDGDGDDDDGDDDDENVNITLVSIRSLWVFLKSFAFRFPLILNTRPITIHSPCHCISRCTCVRASLIPNFSRRGMAGIGKQ